MVFSSVESFPTLNVTWNPLRSFPLVTEMDCRACITTLGAGTGTAGPISSVRWTPLSIRRSGDPLRQRDADAGPRPLGQLLRAQRAVGVAQAPELLRVPQVLVGHQVRPFALLDDVLGQRGEPLRTRDEPPPQVRDAGAVLKLERLLLHG